MFLTRIRMEGFVFDLLHLVHHLGVLGQVVSAQQFVWCARYAGVCFMQVVLRGLIAPLRALMVHGLHAMHAAGAYAVTRAATIVYHIITAATVPRARPASLLTMGYQLVPLALAVGAAFATNLTVWLGVSFSCWACSSRHNS